MQKVVTTTAQNTKISPNSPARKSPGNGLSPESLGRIAQKICRNGAQKKNKLPHQEPRRNFPIPRNEQIRNVSEKSKDTKYM